MDSSFLPIDLLFGILVSLWVPLFLTALIRYNQNGNIRASTADKYGIKEKRNGYSSPARQKSSIEVVTIEKDLGKMLKCTNKKVKLSKNLVTNRNSMLHPKERKENSEFKYMSNDRDEMIGISESISFLQK